MSFSKWIGASIGWSFGGPIGAIIGLALGSVIDAMADGKENPFIGQGQTTRGRGSTYRTQPRQRPQTESGDFEVSLLVLASVVIKADGVQDQRELDFVRQQFIGMYGKERANHAFSLFKEINKQQISARQVSMQIRQMMDHAARLQLLHFLFGIAKADGIVVEAEVKSIHTIANYLGINLATQNRAKSHKRLNHFRNCLTIYEC